MEGRQLEDRMLGFINGDYDVLIATSIIENGLDIPNANTIIINNAHHFGLSDLHQLRGRVGRSNKRAFCYLIAPPLHLLTPEARRRLRAVAEYSELGSGFNIALQDLDIRGAGNLLGAEQSGFIADIGFETYQKILNEAMMELRESEYKLSSSLITDHSSLITQFVSDTSVDSDMELLFPESYIESTSERVRMYRELDEINDENTLQRFAAQLKDRFGEMPDQSVELLEVVRLRWLAMGLGIERIMLKSDKMVLYFVSDPESSYYQSAIFAKVLEFVQKHPRRCRMKEANNKLTLAFEQVTTVEKATKILASMAGNPS